MIPPFWQILQGDAGCCTGARLALPDLVQATGALEFFRRPHRRTDVADGIEKGNE